MVPLIAFESLRDLVTDASPRRWVDACLSIQGTYMYAVSKNGRGLAVV
jgi:hypothetical protein